MLSNDTDADGDKLSAELKTPPKAGNLVLSPNGSFTFDSAEAPPGTYSFVYLADDGNGALTPATGIIEVTPPSLAFVSTVNALDDTITSFSSKPIVFNVLENDEADDLDTLQLVQATPPSVGQLTAQSDGTITFEPPAGWQGETTFTYSIASASGQTDEATVTIVVGSPVVRSDSITIDSYSTIAIPVLTNDISEQGTRLRIVDFEQPETGLVELRSDGTISFTPTPGFVGVAEFTYTASDEDGRTGSATVRVEVLAEAQIRGLELAEEVGASLLEVDAPIEVSEAPKQPSLTSDGIGLFVVALFSQLGALRLDNLWLAIAVLWAITFFGFLAIFSRRPLLWAVKDVDRLSTLEAFESTNRDKSIFRFAPDAEGIWSTGKAKRAHGLLWRQVETPAGIGWVDADKLRKIEPDESSVSADEDAYQTS